MPYRFAIVGCGHVSGRHAAAIQEVGKLVGVCDVDPARAQELAGTYNTETYTDMEHMLGTLNPDFVTICTPSGLHAQHISRCLEAGTSVLCEKPLAIDSATAAKLVKQAGESGKKLFVVKQNRFNPPVVQVKNLLERGDLGKIHGFQLNCSWNRGIGYFDKLPWRGRKAMSGGILFTQFSHFIDLLYWFLGEVKEASGWRANFLHGDTIDFEDTGSATLLMESGAIGSLFYTINAYDRNMEGSFTLFGDKGTVRIGGEYLNRIDHLSLSNKANLIDTGTPPENGHLPVYREMLRAIEDPAYYAVEASDALKSIGMIEKIYQASPMLS